MILLTGASGFIGGAFLSHAITQGWRVRVITRQPEKWQNMPNTEILCGDFAESQDWVQALKGVHTVVNTAAEIRNTSVMQRVNVDGPLELMNAALQHSVKRWIQLSSVGAYGPVREGVVTEVWPDNPQGPYERTKADFDRLLMKTAKGSKLEVCIVRPSNVYGAGMSNKSIYQLINSIRSGFFAYIGMVGASANYVHVDDVVQAMALCVTRQNAANQTYIVSAWATMEDMVNALANGAKLPLPTRRINLHLAILLALVCKISSRCPLTLSRVQAMSLHSQYSTKKIESELGWRLSVTTRDGMRLLAEAASS